MEMRRSCILNNGGEGGLLLCELQRRPLGKKCLFFGSRKLHCKYVPLHTYNVARLPRSNDDGFSSSSSSSNGNDSRPLILLLLQKDVKKDFFLLPLPDLQIMKPP